MEKHVSILPSARRESRDFGWLKTNWLFSFDDYFDPDNVEFGVLRVFNDDIVAPGRGFPAHRHSEMEIVTIVLSGRLSHRDSAGNSGFLSTGDVQRMSAGTGVFHSEINEGKEPLHILQLWFIPDQGGVKPSYEEGSFPTGKWRGRLLPLVSGIGAENALTMRSPATLYGSMLDPGQIIISEGDRRKVFIYLLEGDLSVEGREMEENGQARCEVESAVHLSSSGGALFVAVEMPEGGP